MRIANDWASARSANRAPQIPYAPGSSKQNPPVSQMVRRPAPYRKKRAGGHGGWVYLRIRCIAGLRKALIREIAPSRIRSR